MRIDMPAAHENELMFALGAAACHDWPAQRCVNVSVREDGDGWRIEDAQGAVAVSCFGDLTSELETRLRRLSDTDAPSWAFVPCASLELEEGRLLLVAEPGGGRSVAALTLLAAGLPVASDEGVVVRGGQSRPLSGAMGAYDPIIGLVDQAFGGIFGERRFIPLAERRSRFSPLTFGCAWRVQERTVAAIIFLEVAPHTLSMLTPIGRHEAAQRLAGLVRGRSGPAHAAVMEAVGLAARPAALLRFGEPVSAAAAVRRFAALALPAKPDT